MTEGKRQEWTISGMDCAACSRKVTVAVERLPGVRDVSVALMSEKLSLRLTPGQADAAAVEGAVRKLGYGIAPRGVMQGGEDRGDRGDPGVPILRRKAATTPEGHQHGPGCQGHDHDHGEHDHGHDHGNHDHAAHNHGAGGHSHDDPADRDKPWYGTAKGRLVIGTGLLLALATLADRLAPDLAGRWPFVLACLIGVAPVMLRAYQALRLGAPFTIEGLMTIATLGALVIGAQEEAALVVFLFALGEMLEGVAAGRARQGIRALGALVPKTAQILAEDGTLATVAAASLRPGQRVLVRPGERIPADGTITEGRSGVDESPVTGESIPVTRGPDDPVFAGAINTEAALTIRVTRAAADNTIARIIRLVEEAEEARAPTERFIDRFSRWYMPAIVALAAAVALAPPLFALASGGAADWSGWAYRGLALLLIGCPCALVISVPAAIASGLSAGARRGLLMKGGAVIEAAARVRQIAFDKTGTLTLGQPQVTDISPAPGFGASDALALAAAVETGSNHPLARAITQAAADQGLALPAAQGARALPGRGAEAQVAPLLVESLAPAGPAPASPAPASPAWVSAPRHALAEGALPPDLAAQAQALEAQGKTVVVVHRKAQALGLIALRDEPRPEAKPAMQALRALGVTPVMLTGDNRRTAAAIAAGLGMEARAEMLPEDKLAAIRALGATAPVMMVGDGINDAPALKQAHVGVAIGSGTDVALEAADAAILRNTITDVPALLRLARATMGNIRQNVALALGLKAVFLVTSVLGITGLWIAILADTGATVLVTLNALRLLRLDPTREG